MANDAVIIGGLLIFFITLSIALPYIENELEATPLTTENYNTVQTQISEASRGDDSILNTGLSLGNAFKILLGALLWIPDLSAWYNILLIPLRLVFYFIIFRNIWIGGGA